MIRVQNMTSPRSGREVTNQFKIFVNDGVYFQSYDKVIVYKDFKNNKVYLDKIYWGYSRTTAKYRNMFLGYSTQEIKNRIKEGLIILTDLNK